MVTGTSCCSAVDCCRSQERKATRRRLLAGLKAPTMDHRSLAGLTPRFWESIFLPTILISLRLLTREPNNKSVTHSNAFRTVHQKAGDSINSAARPPPPKKKETPFPVILTTLRDIYDARNSPRRVFFFYRRKLKWEKPTERNKKEKMKLSRPSLIRSQTVLHRHVCVKCIFSHLITVS